MIFWLIDTDHYSLQERGHPRLRERLAAVPPDSIAVSVVTMEEMLRGRLAMLSRRLPREEWAHAYQKLMDTASFFELVRVLPFDMACQEKFEELRARRVRVGTSPALAMDTTPGSRIGRRSSTGGLVAWQALDAWEIRQYSEGRRARASEA